MRVALVSPYSWTYPGGVTRHIEALAGELLAAGHDVRVLAPYDRDDRRSALAAPRRAPAAACDAGVAGPARADDRMAVERRRLEPLAYALRGLDDAARAARRQVRVVHLHEPVTPVIGWDALTSTDAPLVGTFHCYSESAPAACHRRRCSARAASSTGSRVRIAVSDAAAWTGRRFYGGTYRVIPNGVELPEGGVPPPRVRAPGEPLEIVFVGQAVERKGLPILLRAFEALREHVPAKLTVVGASESEVAPLLVDRAGVTVLGRVSDDEKRVALRAADVLAAPSLGGESFGMVLTEGFAAGTPAWRPTSPATATSSATASTGCWSRAATPPRSPRRCATWRSTRLAPPGWAPRPPSAPSATPGLRSPRRSSTPTRRRAPSRKPEGARRARRGADRAAPRRPRPAPPGPAPAVAGAGARRRAARPVRRCAAPPWRSPGLASAGGAFLAVQHIGVDRIGHTLVTSSPTWVLVGLALMCVSMIFRAVSWHAILKAALPDTRPRFRDAWQGTAVGVLMSATLPARLGEPSRALIVARRLGRPREALPVVLGTLVSQTLLNVLALVILGAVMFSTVGLFAGREQALVWYAVAPIAVLLAGAHHSRARALGAARRARPASAGCCGRRARPPRACVTA